MKTLNRLDSYQRQDILTATPEQLIVKLYDIAIVACNRNDSAKVRRVLVELISALDFERGGEVAERLSFIYEFCMRDSATGNLNRTRDFLAELRDAWKQGVLSRQPA